MFFSLTLHVRHELLVAVHVEDTGGAGHYDTAEQVKLKKNYFHINCHVGPKFSFGLIFTKLCYQAILFENIFKLNVPFK